jgi:hypothetical protein
MLRVMPKRRFVLLGTKKPAFRDGNISKEKKGNIFGDYYYP